MNKKIWSINGFRYDMDGNNVDKEDWVASFGGFVAVVAVVLLSHQIGLDGISSLVYAIGLIAVYLVTAGIIAKIRGTL